MSGAVSSALVAKKFIDLAGGDDVHLSKLKLMKLVYIAQGWHLAYHEAPLINEEVEAWQYGPVFPNLLAKMKKYKKKEVVKEVLSILERSLNNIDAKIGEKGINIIEGVSKQYERNTGGELCGMTHMPGTPWDITCQKHGGHIFNPVIDQYVIRDYYIDMLKLENTGTIAHDG